MTLRISTDLDQRLAHVSAAFGISKNQLVVEALEDYLTAVEQRELVRASVQRVVARDQQLLKRLADA